MRGGRKWILGRVTPDDVTVQMNTCSFCEEPITGRAKSARVCMKCLPAKNIYNTTRSNLASGFNRTHKGSPVIEFTLNEFVRWRRGTPQVCAYCHIHEEQIPLVGMRSQVQKLVRVMGVDRVDSARGYTLQNIVPSCFVCNQIKGDRFNKDEMQLIGGSIASVWKSRLDG